MKTEEIKKEEIKTPLGAVKAIGVKTIDVKARDAISVRGQIMDEMRSAQDTYFADRHFCDKHHVSNQQVNQLMRQLENSGQIERVRPQCADPYGQLPAGRRIMNRWKV